MTLRWGIVGPGRIAGEIGDVVEVAAMFDRGRRPGRIETLPLVNQATPFPLNEMVIYGTQGRIDGPGITRPEMDPDPSRLDGLRRVQPTDAIATAALEGRVVQVER